MSFSYYLSSYIISVKEIQCSIIDFSETYQAALKQRTQMLREALAEIDEYCEKNAWLNEIHVFCKNWKEDTVKQWHGAAAFTIEVDKFE